MNALRCKACAVLVHREENAIYYQKSKARILERLRLWRIANPDKVRAQWKRENERRKQRKHDPST